VIWLVLGAFAGAVGIAYSAALGVLFGVVVGLCLAVLVFTVLWLTSPVLVVSPDNVSAGPATLPIISIAQTSILDPDGVKLARDGRHPHADARSYTLIRPWAGSAGVLITLFDDADPHPSWVVTSRNPAALVAAIQGAR
jgi:hypothetical protein